MKSIINKLLSLLIIINTGIIYSQDYPMMFNSTMYEYASTLSTPEVYNFEKYNLVDINHHVGKANISIPIYTIEIEGIKYPISLSYDTGGIKVDQIASEVGLGWNITKGVITRVIHEENDFTYYPQLVNLTQLDKEERGKFVNVGMHMTSYRAGLFARQKKSIKYDDNYSKVDFLPDSYNLYVGDFKTKFFFKDIDSPIEESLQGSLINAKASMKRFLPFSNYTKGIFYQYTSMDFFSLDVKRNNGIHYYFNDYDISTSFNRSTSLNGDRGAPQVSAWYISKIYNSNTGQEINFEYIKQNKSREMDPFSEELMKTSHVNYIYTSSVPYESNENCMFYDYPDARDNLTKVAQLDIEKSILKKIKFPGGIIEFYYNNSSDNTQIGNAIRKDVWKGHFLTTVLVKDSNNSIIKKFDFNYGYFESDKTGNEFRPYTDTDYDNYRYSRLKLLSIKDQGNKTYQFSYNEKIKLPPINSFSIDFLGYFNNSKDIRNTWDFSSSKKPTLYYYPNSFEKSLLPFEAGNKTHYKLEGYFDRRSNDFSKAWTLNRIDYPLGGSSTFEYELNSFLLFDTEVNGGGLRLSKQILSDGNNITDQRTYEYKTENGKSSGTIYALPFMGHPTRKFFDVRRYEDQEGEEWWAETDKVDASKLKYFRIFDKANLNSDITIGSYVGYSRVIENSSQIGKTELTFTSNELYPNNISRTERYMPGQTTLTEDFGYYCIAEFLIMNSGISSDIFTDNSFKRGKLLTKKIFDNNNTLQQEVNNSYISKYENAEIVNQPVNQPVYIPSSIPMHHLLTATKIYKREMFLLDHQRTIDYSNGAKLATAKNFYYNKNGILDGYIDDIKTTQYSYPDQFDSSNLSNEEIQGAQLLITNNNISTPIEINYINFNDEPISSFRNTYKKSSAKPDVPLINRIQKKSTDETNYTDLKTVTKYNAFNPNNVSKPQVILDKTGISTGYIWGYHDDKLIVQIDNFENQSILTSNTNFNSILLELDSQTKKPYSKENEKQILKILKNLRNYLNTTNPNSLVTTYTYKPLVGLTSKCDSKENCQFYEYDSLNRIQFIKDNNENILKEYNYNIKDN